MGKSGRADSTTYDDLTKNRRRETDLATGEEHVIPPDDFDLDAWIDGAKPLRQTVTIYARGDLMPRIDELVAELEQLRDTDTGDGERSLAEAPRATELRDQLRELWDEYEASGVNFVLQQCSQDQIDAVQAVVDENLPVPAQPAAEDASAIEAYEKQLASLETARAELFGLELCARSVCTFSRVVDVEVPDVRPVFPEHLLRMKARFGAIEFGRLPAAAQQLTFAGQVSVPFSRRVSRALIENTSA